MEELTKLFKIKRFLFNKAIRVLLVTNAMILISAYMLGPIYALYVEKIGGDLLDASLAGGIMALSAGLTTLVSGRFSDRIKRPELVVVLGYLLIGLGFFLYLFVNSIWFLLICQVVIGLGEAIYSPAFDNVYSHHLTKRREGEAWGAWESMNYFSAAGGALIGGLIVTRFGFVPLFLTMASLCFISAIYIYKLPKYIL